MRHKIVYFLSIVLFLFSGCGFKSPIRYDKSVTNVSKPIVNSDKIIKLEKKSSKIVVSDIEKFPINSSRYEINIKAKKIEKSGKIKLREYIVTIPYTVHVRYDYLKGHTYRNKSVAYLYMGSKYPISDKELSSIKIKNLYDYNSVFGSIVFSVNPTYKLTNKINSILYNGSKYGWAWIYKGKHKILYEKNSKKSVKNIKDLRERTLRIGQKKQLFYLYDKNTKTSPVTSKQIQIENIPSWIKYSIKDTKDGVKLILKIVGKGKSFFKNDAKRYGISKKYIYLIDKYTDKKIIPIRIKVADAKPVDIKIAYYDGERLYAKIKRLKSLGYGFIKFTSNQKNVDIFVDGLKMGKITKKPFVAKIVEGKHIITAKKYLFGSKSIEVKIKPNDAFSYHFELLPSGNMNELVGNGKIVQSTGTLTVLTSRNDLEVNIDGAIKIPPFKLPNIATGKYTIKIKGPNIKKSITIEVLPNKNNVYNLDNLLKK